MNYRKRDWGKIIQCYEKSGKSIKEYCAYIGIHPNTFYKYRKLNGQRSLVEIPAPVRFEINPIILKTKNYSLAVSRGFDAGTLKSVLQVIGEVE